MPALRLRTQTGRARRIHHGPRGSLSHRQRGLVGVVPLHEGRRRPWLYHLTPAGARIVEGGTRAFYRKSDDQVTLPDRFRFKVAEEFYATGLHELTHWTGHESRLDRIWGKRFGDEAYAFEELVAEMGSAFLSAKLGLQGELQHANYIGGWLKILKQDDRALIKAASQAQKAFEYLHALVEGPKVEEPESERLVA